MNQPQNNRLFSLSVTTLIVVILALILIPQVFAVTAKPADMSLSSDYLNREYTYTHRTTQTSNSYTTSTKQGILVSTENGLLVFATQTQNSTHYTIIHAENMLSMQSIDD